jgi:phospholipid transport system substrate-binding protein
MLRHRSIRLLIAFLVVLPGFSAAATGPAEQVRGTVDDVLVVLRDKELLQDDRRRRVQEAIGKRFDFTLMSRAALSVNWKKATPEQRRRFVDLFTELLLLIWTARLDEYHDESVRYGEEKIRGDRATVSTFVVSGDKEIPVDYRLHNKNGEWLVYDVLIEHVSQVSNYRNSYRGIVEEVGIDGLLDRLETKVAELRTKDRGAGD